MNLSTINEMPTYIFTVPSTGKDIKFRPFVHKEEKILQIAKESEDPKQFLQAVKDTIAACTFNAVNVDELASFDIEELFILLRAKSVGENLSISLLCKNIVAGEDGNEDFCNGKNDFDINLEDVKVDRGKLGKKKNNDNIIKLNEKVSVEMKYPSFDTIEALSGLVNNENVTEENLIDILYSCIHSVFTKDDMFVINKSDRQEFIAFVDSLTPNQLSRIFAFLKNIPTVEYTIKSKCKTCGKEIKYTFRGINDFFG